MCSLSPDSGLVAAAGKRRRVRHQHFWRNSDKLPPEHRLYVTSADIKLALEQVPVPPQGVRAVEVTIRVLSEAGRRRTRPPCCASQPEPGLTASVSLHLSRPARLCSWEDGLLHRPGKFSSRERAFWMGSAGSPGIHFCARGMRRRSR